MHLLDLDIDDTNLNPRAFKVSDNSVYDTAISVSNPLLEITPPGFIAPIVNKVNKGFVKIYNANLLKLNSAPLKELPSLPDGIYNIKYSVAPNAIVQVEFDYFRNVKQLNQYMTLFADLIQNEHKYSRRNFLDLRSKLWNYKQYIDAAKYLVEDRHKPQEGIEIYQTMCTNLDKFKELC
jgi:hypothetical protein